MIRRTFLSALAAVPLAAEETFTASATRDNTPQVGLIGSHFKGSEEMDGSKLPGLRAPAALDAELSPAQWDDMVARAMELGRMRRGNIRSMMASEDWITLLVRSANGDEPGTDPGIVRSVVRYLVSARRGKRITIARGGDAKVGEWAPEWQAIADQPNVRVDFVDLNDDRYLEAPSMERPYAKKNPEGRYAVARTIRECDRVILVAPWATHPDLGTALGAWNYWGIAPGSVYGYPKSKLREFGSTEEVLADLYLHKPPNYAVLGGPWAWNGQRIRHNVIAAGGNAMAVETAAAVSMGFDADKIGYLDKLHRRGAGTHDIFSIWTRGHETDEVLRDFRKGSRS